MMVADCRSSHILLQQHKVVVPGLNNSSITCTEYWTPISHKPPKYYVSTLMEHSYIFKRLDKLLKTVVNFA